MDFGWLCEKTYRDWDIIIINIIIVEDKMALNTWLKLLLVANEQKTMKLRQICSETYMGLDID